MSQRQTIARTRRQRMRSAAGSSIARAPHAPARHHGGRGALLSGTAFAALVACGLFGFNDRALAQSSQLPTGGVVVGGSATITQTGTSQLTINQTTDRGVIDWRSFSIGQGNRVDFIQPGRTSVTLNRVTGPDPSIIAGALNANGQVVLINQAGVMFAGGAQVNVESLIASTANVANPSQFMAGGRIAFDQAGTNPNARIVNDGTITVRDGGLVSLIGPSAANNGVINARLGRVTVGGYETFTVDLNGDGLVSFAVGKPVSQTPRDADGKALALASNTGTINADGGVVAITAAAAREVVNGVVNVEGRINARTVQNEGGVIVFGGGETTQVNVAGTIDVSGAGAAQKGGTVTVTASKVAVQSTARINANGGAGGGTVLIGGGKQGAGPIANAKDTTVAKGAIITADATNKGNGGTVIIWADNATVFGGTITANGGPLAGDGGFVETSGHVMTVLPGATVTANAPAGAPGLWLLDPLNFVIDAAAAAAAKAALESGTNHTITTNVAGAEAGNVTQTAAISVGTTNNANVTLTIEANGTITLSKDITLTPSAGKSTTLALDTATNGGTTINAAASTITASVVTFNAGGTVTINDAANVIGTISGTTSAGSVTIVNNSSLTIAAAGLSAGAASSVSVTTTGASSNLTVSGTVSGTGATITAGKNLSGTAAISGGTGAVSLKASGSSGINLSGAITGTSLSVQANSGVVTLSSVDNVFNTFTAAAAIGGDVTVVHKGGLSISALDVGSNTASFTTNTAGNITLSGDLDSTGGVTLNAAGTLAINAKINATGTNVELNGVTAITQTAAGIITATALGVSSTGTADLSQATSAVTTLAANVGSIAFLESNGFTISEVGTVVGLTASGTAQLQAAGTITQNKAVTAGTLAVRATAGDINLTVLATNDVTTFAAKATAGFVALSEATSVQIGSAGAVGTLAALDGVTATTGVSIRTAAGSVTQTGAGVITAGAGGLAVSVTGGNIALDTAENATSAIAFSSPGTASYKTSSDLNVSNVAALGSLSAVSGATVTGTLTLVTTGAATVITQNKPISAATLDLTTGANGTVTLTTSTNTIGTLQSAAGLGTGTHQIVDSAGGLNVGALTTTGDLSITTTGALTITGDLNAGAKTLALTANSSGAITATASVVTAGTLTLEGGVVNFDSPTSHDVGTVQTTATGVNGLTYRQSKSGLLVGLVTSTADVSIAENGNNANVTLNGALTATGKIVNISANAGTGQVIVNSTIAGSDVALIGRGGVSQADAGAAITATTLRGQSSNGSVALAPNVNANNVGTFAGFSTVGSVSFRNVGTFTVGKVNLTSGINAATSVTLQVNNAGGTINQTAGADGAIITPTLNLTTNNGSVTINSANNDIAALGTVNLGSGTLTVSTARAAGFDVGAVTANGGIDITNTTGDLTTSAAIASDGNISLRSTTGTLTLGGTVTSNNNGVTLRSSGALNTGASLVSAATAVTGDVTLISDTSTVTIGAGGVTVGDTLTIQIGAGLLLNITGAITATSVALHADAIDISAAVNATGTITLAPVTAGTAVTVGGAAAAGFVIDSTELTFLNSASVLTIGKQSTGTTTAGAITLATGAVGNATLNLFSTAGISQTGILSVGGGTGTLNITAAGTVSLGGFGSGVAVGQIGGSTTSGDFLIMQGGSGALQANAITTAGGDIVVRNFSNSLTVAGNLSSSGGVIAVGANLGGAGTSTLTVNGSLNAGTGAVVLFARDGITQGGASVVTGGNLLLENLGTGSVSVDGQNVISGNTSLTNANGTLSFTNTVAFTLGGLSSVPTGVGSFSTQGFGLEATTATLTVGGTVTQSSAAGSAISVTTLNVARVGATNPTVTFDNANNAVTNVGTINVGSGSFTLVDGGGLSITGNATAGTYSLTTSGGSISQGGGTSITANSVVANATGGGFIGVFLNSATNAFSAISGSTDGLFGFGAVTTKSLTANAITSTTGGVALTTTGATSDLVVNDLIAGGTGGIFLTAGRNLSQTATGGVVSSQLQANATSGTVDLTTGAANNNVSTIAGQASGSFAYTDANTAALTIGTVSTSGITSTAGDITVKATKTAATLSATQVVTASGATGNVTLQSDGDLTFTAGLTATKRVTLTSTAGAINQGSGSGLISGAELLANAATNVDLSTGGHSVGATGFAATATAGYVAFLNNTALTIDSVGGTNGVTAGGAIFIGVSNGNLTQTAAGIITAGAGLGLFAANGSIVFDQQNLITGNVAVVSSPNADVTIRTKGDLNVGQVGPLTIFGGGTFTADGILASTAAGKFVSLISDTGVITQDAAATSRILGRELRITTTGKNATLTNTSNSLVEVGNSNLGAGRLTVFDGVGDLTLSNPVVADGGVVLTTQTTFTLPGSITVANGDISLTSLTGSISLTSTLSAVNGQVQLDAGAGDITQTNTGIITAKTLIARAPGAVTLSGSDNNVGTIAGSAGTGTFTYVDKTAVTIGSLVDSTAVTVNGITTTNQDILVLAGKGGASGGIAVDQAVNAGAAIVRLQTSKGDITQAATGVITANSLLINAFAGSINLAAVANAISTVAGKSGGSLRLLTTAGLNVATVAADGGALTTAGAGLISSGDMAIQTAGNLLLFNGLDAGAGTMRLRMTAGGVFQAATANVIADALLVDATGTVSLNASANNDINTLAGRSTGGTFKFQDVNGFTVGTVGADGAGLGPVLSIGPLTGITTTGTDITLVAATGLLTINEAINAGVGGGTIRLQTGTGDLTQGVNGTLTGGSLLAVSTGGMVNLTGAKNNVTGIAGTAFTSFLFQNEIGYTVSNVAFAGDGIIAAATGITANSGGGATARVVDLAVASGALNVVGPVSSANGMIVYRRTPTGAAGAINVGGGAGTPANSIGTAKLVVIDLTGAAPVNLYGGTPGTALGGLFTTPTPATGFSPLPFPGSISGGSVQLGELTAPNATTYLFGSGATFESTGPGAIFGVLGLYGNSNTAQLSTNVRQITPTTVRLVTDPYVEPFAGGAFSAFFVRHDGLPVGTEQFNGCPIGTINCVVFTTPIAAPSVNTDDVVIGVAGAPLDDSGIVLVNQGNEDLIIDESDEERRKRRAKP